MMQAIIRTILISGGFFIVNALKHTWIKSTNVGSSMMMNGMLSMSSTPTQPEPTSQWVANLKGLEQNKQFSLSKFDGIRGIMADEPLSLNDIILKVPEDLAIQTANNRPPTPFPDFVSQRLWEDSKWDQRICYKLLWENEVLGVDSTKYSWLKQLPQAYDTTFYWGHEELSELQYSSIVKKIQKQRREWREIFDNWQKDCKYLVPPQKGTTWGKRVQDLTYERFVWGLETVNSRAFSGSYEGSSAADRRNLLFFTGILTLAYPVLGFGTYEEAIQGAVAVGLSIFLKDYFFSKNSNLKRYVVCPLIDMFNHKSTCNSEASFNYFNGCFELSTEKYQKGDQIFISYGKQSNDRFLQYYGFVEENNMNDIYDFGQGILELLLKYAEPLSTVIDFPGNPAPEERLKAIASGLRVTDLESQGQQTNTVRTIAMDSTTRYYRSPIKNNNGNLSEKLSRFDEISVACVRALVCSESEWNSAQAQKNLMGMLSPLSPETEERTEKLLASLCFLELKSKPTSLEDDIKSLQKLIDGESKGFSQTKGVKESKNSSSSVTALNAANTMRQIALTFRIEKKKMLMHASS